MQFDLPMREVRTGPRPNRRKHTAT